MQSQWQKAIKLAKKTGDRLIVFDSAHESDICVVMSLDDYEKLVISGSEVRGLTEEELLDKINRDIAIWKSEQDFWGEKSKKDGDFFADEASNPEYEHEYGPPVRKDEDDRKRPDAHGDYIGAVARSRMPKRFASHRQSAARKKNPWAIPSARKEVAEEIIEEDRQ